ncbi:hypothetical protein ACHAXM_007863 [Skeletonema potamos]|jgi:hypothetical protein
MLLDDDNQVDEINSRRQEELEALQAFYGHQLRASLPAPDDIHDEVISFNGPWFIELIDKSSSGSDDANNYKIPTLEIRLPPHYPLSPPPSSQSSSLPTLILHHVDSHHLLTSLQKQELIEELKEMYEPEMDMAIMWAERCREEFSEAAAGADTGNDDDNDAITSHETNDNCDDDKQQSRSIRFLTYNHLLYGKSHKKESQIVSLAGKMGLIGFIVYGTPGIIGLLMYNGNDDDIREFAKECSNRIGKRATVLDFEIKIAPDGELLSSLVCDDFGEAEGGRNNNNGGKKNKSSIASGASKRKLKSKGGSANNISNKPSAGESSRPLLGNLLGADRVTITNDSVSIVDNNKGVLRHFESLAELKEVWPNCGFIQSILGM